MEKKTLDIILPCYNPINGWQSTILDNLTSLEKKLNNYNWKVVVVDDGTSNGLFETTILTESDYCFEFVLLKKNYGKGYALRQAVSQSNSHYVIYTDIDFPYTKDSMLKVLEKLSDYDVVLTKRSELYYSDVPKIRRLISKTLKSLISIFLNLPFTDTQTGLKAFSEKSKKHFIDTKAKRYLFDLEFVRNIFRDKNTHYGITEVSLKDDVVFSTLSWKIILKELFSFCRILWS